MSKKSNHPRYDDPTAFWMRWPRIQRLENAQTGLMLIEGITETVYKMGKVRASVAVPNEKMPGYFMTVRCNDRYPTWDEIVWLRYNLIPDAAIMSLILPNLNRYINQEDTGHKYVFTMQQEGWAVEPTPVCAECVDPMRHIETRITTGIFQCELCGIQRVIDLTTWNEQHGNGFSGQEKK